MVDKPSSLDVAEIFTSKDSGIRKGEERTHIFRMINKGIYPIRVTGAEAFTVHEDNKPTPINYVTKIGDYLTLLTPGQYLDVDVAVKLPSDYNATFIYKGITAIRPIDVEFIVYADEYVSRDTLS